MTSPYVVATETGRTTSQPVGFEQVEPNTVAEIVSAVARTDRQPWRADFRGVDLDTTTDWQTPQIGAGGSVVAGAGSMTIATGTIAGSTTYVRSQRKFRTPLRASIAFTISQRIANQEFYIELTNADGTAFARWKFDGTVVTSAKVEVGTSAIAATLNSTTTVLTTATSQVVELDLGMDEANFRTRTVDSNVAAIEKATRNNNLPHPDDDLYLQIRSVNLSTAPASNTNFTINYLFVQDVNELAVEVVGGRGNAAISGAVPVSVVSSSTIASNATGWANAIPYTESTALPAANAVVTGVSRDVLGATTGVRTSVASYPKEVRLSASSDQAGTLYLEVSNDATNWYRIKSAAISVPTAGMMSFAEILHLPTNRYARAVFVNGTVAPTKFSLNTLLVSA